MLIPDMILIESCITCLRSGVQEPQTSLGALIALRAKTIRYGTLWPLAFPVFFLDATMFGFCFVDDGLRDAPNQKDR